MQPQGAFFLVSTLLLAYVVQGIDIEVKIPSVISSAECQQKCEDFKKGSCLSWIYEEGCVVNMIPSVTAGFTSDIMLLEQNDCVQLDTNCGFQIPTDVFGNCTIDVAPDQCPVGCSVGCTFVYDTACYASCQPVVSADVTIANTIILLQTESDEVRSEIAILLGIDEAQIEVVGTSPHPDGHTVYHIQILVAGHGLATAQLYEQLAAMVQTQTFTNGSHLASLHSIVCTEGCENTSYDDLQVIPLHRTSNVATLEDYDCDSDEDTGTDCLHESDGTPTLRYRYDENAEECVHFEYRGCGGHNNNYKSRTQCNLQCMTRAEKPSLSCTTTLLMDHYGVTTSELQAYSPLSANVTECRKEFHSGDVPDQDDCYDAERYEELCDEQDMNFCIFSFTDIVNLTSWTDYLCMPEGCNNPDDKSAILQDAINICSRQYGICHVAMDCQKDDDIVEFSNSLLLERQGVDVKRHIDELQSCPNPKKPCTNYDQCCAGMTCDYANEICLGVESFAASSVVHLESGDTKALSKLQVGDSVMSYNPLTGEKIFEEVYHVAHDHWITGSEWKAKMLKISYGDGHGSVTLTDKHLLYLVPQDHSTYRDCFTVGELKGCSYMAREVTKYSILFALDDGELTAFQIDDVEQITGMYRGIHTRSGRVVVDGVLSSCYVKNHNYVHESLKYVRMIHEWWPGLFQTWARTAGEFIDNTRSYYGISAHSYWPAAFAVVIGIGTVIVMRRRN